jgi:hypothetical protein
MDKVQVRIYIDDVYFAYFGGIRNQHRSNEEAYLECESYALENYGMNIFETYEAFRTALHRYNHKWKIEDASKGVTLLNNVGYFNRYREYLDDGLSKERAWFALENEVRRIYNVNIHYTLGSFEKWHDRFINNKRKDGNLFRKVKSESDILSNE